MAKKHPAKKSAKPASKKATPSAKKNPPNKSKPAKSASAAEKKPAPAKPAAPAPAKISPTMEKPSKKSALRDSILKRKTASKPIAFSLDEVRAIAKTVTSKTKAPFEKDAKAGVKTAKAPLVLEKPAKPNHIKAAS